MFPISLIILFIVLCGIAFRKIMNYIIPIWVITVLGAAAVLLTQQITPYEAIVSINPDVMIYLFGVFLISQAAESSGYLEYLTDKIFLFAKNGKDALMIIIFILGLSSALLMNDTVAIIGTPIILQLCTNNKSLIKPLLLALAFSITIGSTMSPIGNPQNLLIAVKANLHSPLLTFLKTLIIPTIINLLLTYLIIMLSLNPF